MPHFPMVVLISEQRNGGQDEPEKLSDRKVKTWLIFRLKKTTGKLSTKFIVEQKVRHKEYLEYTYNII